MSLINRVLRELDRRHATDTTPRPLPSGVRPLEGRARRGRRGLLALVLMLAAAFGAAIWWVGPRGDRHTDVASKSPPPSVAPPVASSPGAVPPAAGPLAGAEAPPAAPEPAAPPPSSGPAPQPAPAPPPAATSDAKVPAMTPSLPSEPDDLELPSMEEPDEAATPSTPAVAEFHRGVALHRERRLAEAEVAWRNAVRLDPGDDLARRALASLLATRGERVAAEQVLADGLAADPRQLRVAMDLTRLQIGGGRWSDALRTLEHSLPYAGGNGEYLALAASVNAHVGQQRAAAQLYDSALRTAPRQAAWLIGLGLALRADGRTDDALEAFRRARTLDSLDDQQRLLVNQQILELGG